MAGQHDRRIKFAGQIIILAGHCTFILSSVMFCKFQVFMLLLQNWLFQRFRINSENGTMKIAGWSRWSEKLTNP